jgi:transmembrane sensor
MNELPSEPSELDEAIDLAAAAWLCERAEGFKPGRAEAFAMWRSADSRHNEAVIRTEMAMALLDEMPALRGTLESRITEACRPAAPVIRPAIFRVSGWAAGLAAAVMLAGGFWMLRTGLPGGPQHYATPAAHQEQIALRDGSVVDLNVSSDLRVQLMANERRVTLSAGEAHFAVAHDTTRPFIVTADGVTVRAVGTAFSVSVGKAGVEVMVTEGKVAVTREASSPSAPPSVERPTLVAGERALIPPAGSAEPAKIEHLSKDVLREANLWHSQVITFSDLPMREAIALFNRRNTTQLVLLDAELGERKIGGTFAADQVEAFVRLLEKDGDIAAERRGGHEIALRRAP